MCFFSLNLSVFILRETLYLKNSLLSLTIYDIGCINIRLSFTFNLIEVPVGKAVSFFSQSSTSIKILYVLSSSIKVCLKFLRKNTMNISLFSRLKWSIIFFRYFITTYILESYLISFCVVTFTFEGGPEGWHWFSAFAPTSIIFRGAFTVTACRQPSEFVNCLGV